jgi:hypothetical protein
MTTNLMQRVLHLVDGRDITDNQQIEQYINTFSVQRPHEQVLELLREVDLDPSVLEPTNVQMLGTLRVIKNASGQTVNDRPSLVLKPADIRLDLSDDDGASGPRTAFQPYWFAINLVEDEPIIVEAQVPYGFPHKGSLNQLSDELSEIGIFDLERPALQAKYDQKLAELKEEIIRRLTTLINQ